MQRGGGEEREVDSMLSLYNNIPEGMGNADSLQISQDFQASSNTKQQMRLSGTSSNLLGSFKVGHSNLQQVVRTGNSDSRQPSKRDHQDGEESESEQSSEYDDE